MACIFLENHPGIELRQNKQVVSRTFDGTRHQGKRCEDCGHIFFDNPPKQDLDKFYQEIYPAGSSSWYNLDADYLPSKTVVRAKRVIDIAERFGFDQNSRFHEIGAAFGGTVQELNQMGFRTTGTELNKDAVRQGRERGNLDIFDEDAVNT